MLLENYRDKRKPDRLIKLLMRPDGRKGSAAMGATPRPRPRFRNDRYWNDITNILIKIIYVYLNIYSPIETAILNISLNKQNTILNSPMPEQNLHVLSKFKSTNHIHFAVVPCSHWELAGSPFPHTQLHLFIHKPRAWSGLWMRLKRPSRTWKPTTQFNTRQLRNR